MADRVEPSVAPLASFAPPAPSTPLAPPPGDDARFRLLADHAPVMLWMSGLDGLCEFFNSTWLAFTGRTLAQERGNGWA
jgi:PAS domain-containing protein